MMGMKVKEHATARTRDSHLCGFTFDPVHYSLEGGLREATVKTGLLVILEASSHSFRAIVEGIAERLVNGLNTLTTSHEDLIMLVSMLTSEHLMIFDNLLARMLLSMPGDGLLRKLVCSTCCLWPR